MTIRNLITSGVKTAVQAGVALAVAALLSIGIAADAVILEAALFPIAAGLVALLLNALGAKWPLINMIVSFGLSTDSASYEDQPSQ